MFSKKKVVPVVLRSRFAKAKPKIGPKSSQSASKNEKEPMKIIEEDKGSELPSNQDSIQETSSVSKSTESPSKVPKSPSIKENEVVSNISNSNADVSEREKSGSTENHNEKLSEDSALRNVSEIPVCSVDQGLQLSVTCASPVSVTYPSPVKNSSFKDVNRGMEDEPRYFSSNKEQPSKTYELVEKVIAHPSPAKSSAVNTTDKSLKYPCLTKILAAPKKRPQNKEMNERKKKMAIYKELPPRSEMTFTDLIYWNPSTAPMKKKEKKLTLFDPIEKESTAAEEEVDDCDDDDEDASIAPKLFVNENGEIIVDETSLVKERKKTFVDMSSEAIILDDSDITYATFRRKVSKKWSPKETVNFYKALSVIGTDFALMETIIPNRTRRELKIKFKKEEKINMELLHRAMYETDTFQSELSVEGLDLDVIDIPGLEECIADDAVAALNGKKSRKRKNQVLSEIASNDGSNENESQPAKRGRGRPKGSKNACSSRALNSSPVVLSDDCSVDSLPVLIRKKVTTLPRDSIDSCENVVIIEADESSPIVRRKKARVLSQDSQDNTDEYHEIDVQVNSLVDNEEKNTEEDNAQKEENVNVNICLESSINPEESPTENTGVAKSAYVSHHHRELMGESIITGHNPLNILSIKNERLESPSLSLKKENLSPTFKQTGNHTASEPTTSKPLEHPKNPKATYQRGRKLIVRPNVKLPKGKNVDPVKTVASSEDNSSNIQPVCSIINTTDQALDILSIKKEKLGTSSKSLRGEPLTPTNKQTGKTIATEPSTSLSSDNGSAKSSYRRGRKLNVKPNVKLPKAKNIDPELIKVENAEQTECIVSDSDSLAVINILDGQLLSEGATDVVTTPAVSRRQKAKGTPDSMKRSLPSSLSYTPVVEPETEQLSAASFSVQDFTLLNQPRFVKRLGQQNYSRAESNKPCQITGSPSGPLLEQSSNSSTKTDSPSRIFCRKSEESSPMIGSPSCTFQTQVPTTESSYASSSPFVTSLNSSSNRILSIPITPEMAGGNETVMLVNPSPNGNSFHFFMSKNFVGNMPLPIEISAPPVRVRKPESVSFVDLVE